MKLVPKMLVVLPAVLTVGGIGNGNPAPAAAVAGPAARATIGCDPVRAEALLAWADAGFSGSLAISTGGEFDCVGAFGMADAATGAANSVDTVFSIGSVSKAFTAAAIFRLVDAGKLALTDRAGALIPDLAGPVAAATVEQLLLHTSGLIGSHGSDHEPLGRDEALAAIGDLEQEFEPGAQFLYSNAGYTLLALIIEEVSDTSYRDYMSSQVLSLPGGDVAGGFWDGEPSAPGPRALGYRDGQPTGAGGDFGGPHWAVDGNGDLAMTAGDLATWTHALFTGQLVSQASTEIIATPGFDQGDGTGETPGWVAYDASMFGRPFLATAGGGGDVGHNAVVVWLPDNDQVIAIASNTDVISGEELLQAIGPALIAGEPLPRPELDALDVDPAQLEAVVGRYELDTGGSFETTVRDGRLIMSATGSDAVAALFPLPGNVTVDEVDAHERDVLALLAGENQEGREERAALEGDLGAIADIQVVATIVDEGELRTYVTVSSADDSIVLWYALNDAGGIAAVEVPDGPPSRVLVPTADGFRVEDPTGTSPAVTVQFDDDRVLVVGPAGTTTAARDDQRTGEAGRWGARPSSSQPAEQTARGKGFRCGVAARLCWPRRCAGRLGGPRGEGFPFPP